MWSTRVSVLTCIARKLNYLASFAVELPLMPSAPTKITSLPTRYEPLVHAFGERARNTFVPPVEDLNVVKRFMAAAESAGQGKLMFLEAPSGAGKSTFVHGLEVFLADRVASVTRLPQPHELVVANIPGYVAQLPRLDRFTVLNFDGREAPYFAESEYQTFLGALNGVLRSRPDLLLLWPVTDLQFAQKLVALLERVGGRSAFGGQSIYNLRVGSVPTGA
jgi:hypothetical protein